MRFVWVEQIFFIRINSGQSEISEISRFPSSLPAVFHEPLKGAAPLLHLLRVELLSLDGVFRPGRRRIAKDVLRVCFREELILVKESPGMRPEPSVSVDLTVLEVEFLVSPCARQQVCLKAQLTDLDLLGHAILIFPRPDGLILPEDVVDDITFLQTRCELVVPHDLFTISGEHLLTLKVFGKGAGKVDLIGHFNFLSVQLCAIVFMRSDVTDSEAEGTLRALS